MKKPCMGYVIERCKIMALTEKEGGDDEGKIDEDNAVGTENNNNDIS